MLQHTLVINYETTDSQYFKCSIAKIFIQRNCILLIFKILKNYKNELNTSYFKIYTSKKYNITYYIRNNCYLRQSYNFISFTYPISHQMLTEHLPHAQKHAKHWWWAQGAIFLAPTELCSWIYRHENACSRKHQKENPTNKKYNYEKCEEWKVHGEHI